MQIRGPALIFLSLFVLAVPGMMFNNLSNSNLANGFNGVSAFALTCPSGSASQNLPDPTCQGSVNVGCQVSSSVCTLSGSSISFLNNASPFTQLIQGNIFGLFTNLNGPGYSGAGAQNTIFGSHGPFDVAQGGNFYQSNCFGQPAVGGSGSQRNWLPVPAGSTSAACTQTSSDNANVSKSSAAQWTNWNTAQSGSTVKSTFYQLGGNASFAWGCNWLANVNYTLLTNGPGFNYYGCDLVHGNGVGVGHITQPIWSILLAFPNNQGAFPTGAANVHQYFFVQLENWDTYDCAAASGSTNSALSAFNSAPCQSFMSNFKGISLGCQSNTCASFVPGQGSPLLGFFLGIALFIGGLGWQVGFGGGVSAGVNRQGTKLMQSIGLGLIGWSFFYSQFATWFTSGVLPYGLDGALGIVSISLTVIFFAGIYTQAVQD